jgi:restriction endonuclease S subunit
LAVKEVAAKKPEAGLPKGWSMVRFDEIAQLVNDRVDNPAEAGVERYVGLEHLDPESLKIRRWGAPTDVEAQKLRFQPGDIIFGKRRAYQRKLSVADFEGICSAHAMVLRARTETVVKDFLPFFMQSDTFFDRALAISVGSLSPTINWKTLASQQFAIPSKDEQRRIANILWGVDEVVLRSEDIIGSAIQLKKAILANINKSASPPLVEIGKYSEYVTSGSRGWAQYYSSQGSIFIRVTNLTREHTDIDLTDIQYVSPPDSAEGVRTRVEAGDILISITADLGRIGVVPEGFPEAYMNQHVALTRLNPKEMNPYFVAYYLLSAEGQKQFRTLNDAGAKAGMNLQNIRKLKVPQIDLSEQNELVGQVLLLDKNIRQTREHLEVQTKLKKKLISLLEP